MQTLSVNPSPVALPIAIEAVGLGPPQTGPNSGADFSTILKEETSTEEMLPDVGAKDVPVADTLAFLCFAIAPAIGPLTPIHARPIPAEKDGPVSAGDARFVLRTTTAPLATIDLIGPEVMADTKVDLADDASSSLRPTLTIPLVDSEIVSSVSPRAIAMPGTDKSMAITAPNAAPLTAKINKNAADHVAVDASASNAGLASPLAPAIAEVSFPAIPVPIAKSAASETVPSVPSVPSLTGTALPARAFPVDLDQLPAVEVGPETVSIATFTANRLPGLATEVAGYGLEVAVATGVDGIRPNLTSAEPIGTMVTPPVDLQTARDNVVTVTWPAEKTKDVIQVPAATIVHGLAPALTQAMQADEHDEADAVHDRVWPPDAQDEFTATLVFPNDVPIANSAMAGQTAPNLSLQMATAGLPVGSVGTPVLGASEGQPTVVADPAGLQQPAMEISGQIAAVLPSRPGVVELTLTPEDLGRIRFEIQQEGDLVRMVLAAERTDTLDIIRRNLPEFLADLRQAGFSGSDVSLGQWSRGPSDNSQSWGGGSRDDRNSRQGTNPNLWSRSESGAEASPDPIGATRRNLGLGPGQLAIRV